LQVRGGRDHGRAGLPQVVTARAHHVEAAPAKRHDFSAGRYFAAHPALTFTVKRHAHGFRNFVAQSICLHRALQAVIVGLENVRR
jgi:hypothetical protein